MSSYLPLQLKCMTFHTFICIDCFVLCRLSLLVTFMQFTLILWKKGSTLSLEILPSRKEQAPNHRCGTKFKISIHRTEIDLILNVHLKRWSLYTNQMAPSVQCLYPGFCNMKWLGVFPLPPGWDASLSQGYPQN